MKTRNLRPCFDALESRQLLCGDAVSLRLLPIAPPSLGYVSPGEVVSDPTPIASSVMGGGPPTTPPPTQLDLNLMVASTSINSIGGAVHVVVTDLNANWKMARVTIDVPGSLKTQLFDTNHGAYTRYYPTSYQPAGGTDYYGVTLTWDETPGMRTVTVTAVYDDPSQTSITKSMAIMVNKPVITSTTLTGNAIHMGERYGAKPGTTYGITGAANNVMGVLFQSVVASTPTSGKFVFVQLMTKAESSATLLVGGISHTRVETLPDSGPYLDIVGGSLTPFMQNLWTTISEPIQSARTLPTRGDSPGAATTGLVKDPDPNSLYIGLSVDLAFDTYLVWQPDSGAYVAVDHISWTYTADATYIGSLAPANLLANYTNKDNWQLHSNHDKNWTQTGDKSVKLLEWANNVPAVKIVDEN